MGNEEASLKADSPEGHLSTRRLVLTFLVLILLALASLWAMLAFSMLLYDSTGRYRDPHGMGLIWGLFLALSPTWFCCWLLFRVWSKRT
jgi:hypothetical protein